MHFLDQSGPVFTAALLAGAATLIGLAGIRWDVRLIAIALVVGLLMASRRSYAHAGITLLLVLTALIFFLRGAIETASFSSEQARQFYSAYSVTVPGQFDYASYLKGLGIRSKDEYEAYMDGETPEGAPGRLAAAVRNYISGKLGQYLGEEDAGVYKAVLIGDKSELDDSVTDLYRSAGISHLLAISGLHVSIIGGGLFYFLKDRLKLGRAHAALVASLFLAFYALVCTMASSVVRASVMLALSFLAIVRMRVYDMRTGVALSFMILLLLYPYRILSSGFQLSFAAVFAIAPVSEEWTRGIEKRIKLMRGIDTRFTSSVDRLSPPVRAVLMSLAIQLMTLPIVAWHYFTFPLYGFFLNFIVIPLMGIVLFSGVALVLLAFLADMAALFSAGLGTALSLLTALSAAPGHYVLRFYAFLAEAASHLPCSSLVTGRPSLYLIIFYYCLLFLVTWLIAHPGTWPHIHSQRLAVAALFGTLFAGAACLRYYEPRAFYVMALDAGQGDSFVIKSGGIYITIDGGSSSDSRFGERKLEPYLLSHRITDIDMMIVSHADSDHTSGIKYLLGSSEYVDVERLYLPAAAGESAEYFELKELFLEAGGNEDAIVCLSDLTRLMENGDTRLSVIYAGNATATDTNRHSDVLLLEKGDFSMLFTGDAETEDEGEIVSLYEEAVADGLIGGGGVTLLKAGHHGSRTSSSTELLLATSPRVALLSYGEGNSYGHPHEETLERLSALGIGIVSTAENGSLLISEDSIAPAR